MARSKSSNRWLDEHVNDPYVKMAQKDGYRSRASYKLLELLEKDRLLQGGMLVMDLGSAPGGWSQVVGRKLGAKGRVIATDILPMDPVEHVEFIQGDFTDDGVFQQILDALWRTPRPRALRHRAQHQRRRCRRPGFIHLSGGTGARHGAAGAQAWWQLRGKAVSGRGIG
jgi:23S rRNA U2552 (ribose-2'-O)-methylase RlmE/FtsJ